MGIYESNYPDWYRDEHSRRLRDKLASRAEARVIREDVECEIWLLERRLQRLRAILEQLEN